MQQPAPQPVFAKDYRPPEYRITRAWLQVTLDPAATRVLSRLEIEAQSDARALPPLVLDGENLELLSIRVNGETLAPDAYTLTAQSLTLHNPASRFQLEIETQTDPAANTALEGLYFAGGLYCSQCEPQGFRRISYFIDRPDNLTIFTVRIIGDKASCPVLLSNGNLIASGDLAGGKHWAEWHDPFPKPSYLFALVAGNLALVQDEFITGTGRKIDLRIYVDPGMQDRCDYAMTALKAAMRWDETRFGLEYDLDIYMIVATGHFNMGAMENKGLNIFNSKFVLARADTATDADFAGIERVIAHEYFHNWTGNRVTCRDWFQLSLKEGLTVFRDQEFCADQRSRPVSRIEDVRALRARQFAEDAGPLAHPVRPASYIEINNFYTATVYEKGAELVRMLQTLIGRDAFAKGVQLYLKRHDGCAATVEDFAAAIEESSGKDLSQFRSWYTQAGTPEISVTEFYDPERREYALTLAQHTPATPGQPDKSPLHIPVSYGLLAPDGADIPGASGVLELTQASQTFRFTDITAQPVPSLFREFSAPVIVKTPTVTASQSFLMAHDTDPFNRWEAGQTYALHLLSENARRMAQNQDPLPSADFIRAFSAVLKNASLEKAFAAMALSLPSEQEISRRLDVINVDAVHHAREALRRDIARALHDALLRAYQENASNCAYSPDAAEAGRRALRNCALGYLTAGGQRADLAWEHYRNSNNMTDSIAALSILSHSDTPQRQDALSDFYDRWQDDALVLDKWFTVQALSYLPGALTQVKALLQHPRFGYDNPNRVRALIGAFCHNNQLGFNASDGSGYRFFADQVLILDKINAQVAARLLTAMDQWRRFDAGRQAHARAALQQILATPALSHNVYEIAGKMRGTD